MQHLAAARDQNAKAGCGIIYERLGQIINAGHVRLR
jgi:hypothetical protein